MGYIEDDKNIGTKGNIAWFVPALLKGGGGHRTIFQNITALINDGYMCDVYIGDSNHHSPNELFQMINEYYGEFHGNVFADWHNPLKEYDCVIATSWNSALLSKKLIVLKKPILFKTLNLIFIQWGLII